MFPPLVAADADVYYTNPFECQNDGPGRRDYIEMRIDIPLPEPKRGLTMFEKIDPKV
jgi:hypothetical protein